MCRECGLIVALNNHQNQLAMEQTHQKDSTSSHQWRWKTLPHIMCVSISNICASDGHVSGAVIYDNILTSNNFQSKNCCRRCICLWVCCSFCKLEITAVTSHNQLQLCLWSSPENLFGFVFLLHDNRAAMSIEFMFVLLHHFVYVFWAHKNYYQLLSGCYQSSTFIKLFMLWETLICMCAGRRNACLLIALKSCFCFDNYQ